MKTKKLKLTGVSITLKSDWIEEPEDEDGQTAVFDSFLKSLDTAIEAGAEDCLYPDSALEIVSLSLTDGSLQAKKGRLDVEGAEIIARVTTHREEIQAYITRVQDVLWRGFGASNNKKLQPFTEIEITIKKAEEC